MIEIRTPTHPQTKGLACLGCTSNNNSGAKRCSFSGRVLVAGAGRASKADTRRGKPSKPRPAKQAQQAICVNQATSQSGLFGLALGPCLDH